MTAEISLELGVDAAIAMKVESIRAVWIHQFVRDLLEYLSETKQLRQIQKAIISAAAQGTPIPSNTFITFIILHHHSSL